MPYRRNRRGVESWTANMVDQSISGSAGSRRGQSDLTTMAAVLAHQGFAFVDTTTMTALLGEAALAGWDGFARSWEDLGPDRFMADGGTYRKRRFACLQATMNRPSRETAATPLSDARQQSSEWWGRARVPSCGRRHRPASHQSGRRGDLQADVRGCGSGGRSAAILACRNASVQDRGTPRRHRRADAGGIASRRGRLGPGADDPARECRRGHHDHRR